MADSISGGAAPEPPRPPHIAQEDWAALPLDIRRELATPSAAAAAAPASSSTAPVVISLLDEDEDEEGDAALQQALRASASASATAAASGSGGSSKEERDAVGEEEGVMVLPPPPPQHTAPTGRDGDAKPPAPPVESTGARKRPREQEQQQGEEEEEVAVVDVASAAAAAASAAAAGAAGKRKGKGKGCTWVALQRGAEEGWLPSRSQDSEWEEGEAEFRRLVRFQEGRTGAIYRDTEFCGMKSITGRESGGKKGGGGGGGEEGGGRPECKCGTKAKLCKVSKEGHNQGRSFWGCPKGRADAGGCGFFKWADDAPAQGRDQDIEFMRFTCGVPVTSAGEAGGVGEDYCIVHPGRGFRSADVRQGGVGDCWFLSALAVVAERPDLIHRVLLTKDGPAAGGMYCARFFIDGRWQLVPVDGYLALRTPKAGATSRSDPKDHILLRSTGRVVELRFSKANERQLWVPLIEKAYAKAHGSYHAISGGFIDEGMFDLTGLPTESIHFGAAGFDSEALWARMLSFQDQGFTMGASCPFSIEGLVGCHAYSILKVRELHDAPIGQQRKISDFFTQAAASASQHQQIEEDDEVIVVDDDDKGKGKGQGQAQRRRRRQSQGAADLPPYLTGDGVLRLVRLRNPWGTREWTGSFGPGSPEWTPKLRELLEGATCKSTKGDGTFWMPYHDFLRCFMSIDVLKAHRHWSVNGVHSMYLHRGEFHPRQALEVRIPPLTTNWTYFSLVQPTKRGKTTGTYWFSDISLLVLQLDPAAAAGADGEGKRRVVGVQHLRLAGQGKVHHTELVLGDAASPFPSHYLLLPFSLNRWVLHSDSALRRGQVRERTLEQAEFTLRVFSARPLELRQVLFPAKPSPSAFLLEQLLRALADRQLLRDSRFFAPPITQAIPGAPGVRLTTYECSGTAVVVLENRNPAGYYVRARLVLHTGATSDFATSHPRTGKAGEKGPEWRVVGPGCKGVVCALGSPALSAHAGEEERELGHRFSMDGLEVEAVPEELVSNLLDRARGIFAWKRVA